LPLLPGRLPLPLPGYFLLLLVRLLLLLAP
jgi:hypothetical protein